MVIITETLTSTLHHDIFTYLDYIFFLLPSYCRILSIFTFIGPYQTLPLRVRVDLGAMAIKRYTAFPKDQALLESHHQIV